MLKITNTIKTHYFFAMKNLGCHTKDNLNYVYVGLEGDIYHRKTPLWKELNSQFIQWKL